ncbi:MAG: 2-iminoacetate synthase ThiH [bacterium]
MAPTLPTWLDGPAWRHAVDTADERAVEQALAAEQPGIREFAALISPAAQRLLEALAQRARALTARHFGRTISLYAPLYLSNYCCSGCVYCGFASTRKITRHKLTPDEIEAEMQALKRMGIEEILLLTGERTPRVGYEYVRACVEQAASHFHSVTVEVFPMTTEEYAGLAAAGCTGMTIYQETYDPVRYAQLHPWGPKRDFLARLDAPARALAAGIRTAGLGALLGLSDPLLDMLCLFSHATYLRRRFWRGGVSLSFPRVRPQEGGYAPDFFVDERLLAQIIFAFRICLPDVPLVLSTRERARFRDGMAGVGICKMSVASRTTVGGYNGESATSSGQFEVNDGRDAASFCAALERKGLQPVFKNWDGLYREAPLELGEPRQTNAQV